MMLWFLSRMIIINLLSLLDFNVVEAILGLKINLEKSERIPLGRVENVEMLAF